MEDKIQKKTKKNKKKQKKTSGRGARGDGAVRRDPQRRDQRAGVPPLAERPHGAPGQPAMFFPTPS